MGASRTSANARRADQFPRDSVSWATIQAVLLGQPRVILATGSSIGEGFDDPRFDTLFLVMPISWRGTLQQYVGRLHGLHEDKQIVQVYEALRWCSRFHTPASGGSGHPSDGGSFQSYPPSWCLPFVGIPIAAPRCLHSVLEAGWVHFR
jgi:hypothetical protein